MSLDILFSYKLVLTEWFLSLIESLSLIELCLPEGRDENICIFKSNIHL